MKTRYWLALAGAEFLLGACGSAPAATQLSLAPMATAGGPVQSFGTTSAANAAQNATVPTIENNPELKAKLENAIYGNGGANLGNPFSYSVEAEQDVVSGATRGEFFISHTNPNESFFGLIDHAVITHKATGGGTAHMTGQLSTGEPFTFDVVNPDTGTTPDIVTFKAPGAVGFAGAVFNGGVRVVRALPAGREFIGTPGFLYDYAFGLPISAADALNDKHGKQQKFPVAEEEVTEPDPVELPNGALPGTFNNLPGIGFNVPIRQNVDQDFFPFGMPLFPNNHPTLLGGALAPIHVPPPGFPRPPQH